MIKWVLAGVVVYIGFRMYGDKIPLLIAKVKAAPRKLTSSATADQPPNLRQEVEVSGLAGGNGTAPVQLGNAQRAL